MQGQGSFTSDGTQGHGNPFTSDTSGQGIQGQGSLTSDGTQGQGNPFTSDTSGQGIQGQGGYAQPNGQDFGQYTQMNGPDTQGVQGQGMDYTNVQGQGVAQPSGTGVEQYNAYGGDFPPGYDPFQATQNTHQALNGLDGVQNYSQPLGDIQSQNPFLDTPGGLQDQMSQIPFGALPSVQAGSTTAPAISASLSGHLLPVAAAAHRRLFGKRNLTPTSKGMCFFFDC